jgi:hypothetical protein
MTRKIAACFLVIMLFVQCGSFYHAHYSGLDKIPANGIRSSFKQEVKSRDTNRRVDFKIAAQDSVSFSANPQNTKSETVIRFPKLKTPKVNSNSIQQKQLQQSPKHSNQLKKSGKRIGEGMAVFLFFVFLFSLFIIAFGGIALLIAGIAFSNLLMGLIGAACMIGASFLLIMIFNGMRPHETDATESY